MIDRTVKFPQIGDVSSTQSYVLVGANGSGKSHLGAWIEKNNDKVLRISAQRALSIPDTINIINEEAAWKKIFYGNPTQTDKGYKWKWGKETSTLVNDYESVLSSVFSRETDELRVFKDLCDKGDKPNRYETIVEKIKMIWNQVLPQRELVLEKFEAKAKYKEELYKAGSMSDGERVCLYLIAQCLITPDDYIIVVDEPEIHLHTSIMKRLWGEIERYCPNKTFVYITHDLNFATSRKTATKIWVQSYDGHDSWEIYQIEDNDDIPEALFLEVLGTRSPILFVEGGKTSYDLPLYKEVFGNYLVIPCDNCRKVIELTKAFNNEKVKSLHTYDVKGLIDHDFLADIEKDSYLKQNIYTLDVLEVENLFLIEPLIKLAAKQIGDNENEAFQKVSDFLFEQMEQGKYDIVNSICIKEIRHKLNCFSSKGNKGEDIQNDLNNHISEIDVNAIFVQTETNISDIIAERDYKKMLNVFNHKGMCQRVTGIIGLKKKYPQVVLDLIKGEKRDEIISALLGYLPKID